MFFDIQLSPKQVIKKKVVSIPTSCSENSEVQEVPSTSTSFPGDSTYSKQCLWRFSTVVLNTECESPFHILCYLFLSNRPSTRYVSVIFFID